MTHFGFIASIPATGDPMVGAAQIAHYTAVLMWAAFGSPVLSLITSAFGGWLGAHHVHRVYHLRRYAHHGREA